MTKFIEHDVQELDRGLMAANKALGRLRRAFHQVTLDYSSLRRRVAKLEASGEYDATKIEEDEGLPAKPKKPVKLRHVSVNCSDCQNGLPCRISAGLRADERDERARCTPFLTGSRAYGKPRRTSWRSAESDTDIVMLSPDVMTRKALLRAASAAKEVRGHHRHSYYDATHATSLRFGDLNLLLVPDVVTFRAWEQATRKLRRRAPVSRKEACAYVSSAIAAARRKADK